MNQEAFRKWRNKEVNQAIHLLEQSLDYEEISKATVLNNLAVVQWNEDDSDRNTKTLEALQKASESLLHQGKSTNEDSSSSKTTRAKVDYAVNLYNKAVIKFRQKLYSEVVSSLRPLFESLDSSHEGLYFGIAFLLFEALLAVRKLKECSNLVNSVEVQCGVLRDLDSNSIKDWQSRFSSSSVTMNCIECTIEHNFNFSLDPKEFSFPVHPKLILDSEASHEEDVGFSNVKHVQRLNACNGARTLFAMRQFSQVHSVIHEIQQEFSGCLSKELVWLKAQTYLAENHADKAFEILMHCAQKLPQTDSVFRSYILNNMGIIYLKLQKQNLSALCFSTSNRNYQSPIQVDDEKENYIAGLYNPGLISLQKSKYSEALKLFEKAAEILYSKPYLWLRMAECCIELSKQKNPDFPPRIKRIPKLDDNLPSIIIFPATQYQSFNMEPDSEGYWLVIAYGYLQNSLVLIQSCPEFQDCTGTRQEYPEKHLIQAQTYLKLTYVTLALNQPEKSLFYVKKLKKIDHDDQEITLLGILYEVEALCFLSNPKEALNRLKSCVDLSQDQKWNLGSSKNQHSVSDLQWIMVHNLASVFCANKDFQQAKIFVQKALRVKPNDAKSLLLLLYIELTHGNMETAMDIIQSQYI